MSQKSTRRARRQTDDDPASFKAPTPKPTEVDEAPPTPQEKDEAHAEITNGTEKEAVEDDVGVVTRNRSATPQVKLTNGHETQEREKVEEAEKSEETKDPETEMDPLIVSDEPDPELVFEETSDAESGRVSPVLSRCKTRRSLTRNIPTPKTPKGDVTPTEENDGKATDDLNGTFESCEDDVSTKAQAGDSTRLDDIDKEVSNLDTNSFLQNAKNKSFGETLRHLSTRRTIRPISEDYRKRILQSNLERGELSYPIRHSVDRISLVGIKRKNFNDDDDQCKKKFKSDSPGFFSKFVSPLASIRNTFRSDMSSTPKLTGYKDEKFLLEDDAINSQMCEINDGQRRWCSIM